MRDTVRKLGFLQMDPISTVATPQELVLWSRLGRYDVRELERIIRERDTPVSAKATAGQGRRGGK